jgi:hypothetical protein
MNKFKIYKKNGFMTLYSVIIVGSIALGLVLVLATSSAWGIKSVINNKNSNQIKALSNACIEIALEAVRENNNFVGTANVNINGNLCSYTVVNLGGNNRTISASGTIKDVTRKVNVVVNSFNPIHIVSWQEVQ